MLPNLRIPEGTQYFGGRHRVVITDVSQKGTDADAIAEDIWSQEDVRDRIRHRRTRPLAPRRVMRQRPARVRLSRQTRTGRTTTSRRTASHRCTRSAPSSEGGSSDGSGPSSPAPIGAMDRAQAVAR